MIPLVLEATVEGGQSNQFVTRLSRAGDGDDGNGRVAAAESYGVAELVGELGNELIFRTAHGHLRLRAASMSDVEDDVVFVNATRGVVLRWIRAKSRHNTLLVTERCDQLCQMCSQPPKSHHVDLFDYFRQAVSLAPTGITIGISGGEPLLYKGQLFELLEFANETRSDLSFHVLTNAQHFDEQDVRRIDYRNMPNVCWGVPLYDADEATHDSIVGKVGAFKRLLQSLVILGRAGAQVELRTVVMKPNFTQLPHLARYISTHLRFIDVWALMQLENIGFARKNWGDLFIDHSIGFSPIGQAIDIATIRGMNVALYNFPRCTVPVRYRQLAGCSISDWKRKYLSDCSGCREADSCCGFFEWHPESKKFAGVRPL